MTTEGHNLEYTGNDGEVSKPAFVATEDVTQETLPTEEDPLVVSAEMFRPGNEQALYEAVGNIVAARALKRGEDKEHEDLALLTDAAAENRETLGFHEVAAMETDAMGDAIVNSVEEGKIPGVTRETLSEPGFMESFAETPLGKKVMSAFKLVMLSTALVMPMKSANAAGGLFDIQSVSGVLGKVERGMGGMQQRQEIGRQQENLRLQIDSIEHQKEALLQRSSGDARVGAIENRAESKSHPTVIDAQYRAEKAQIKAQRAQIRAAFLSRQQHNESDPLRQQHTEADQANYEAQIARIDAREAQADERHEVNQAREEQRGSMKSMQIDQNMNNVNNQIAQMSMQQERLKGEIQRLELVKQRVMVDTARGVMN